MSRVRRTVAGMAALGVLAAVPAVAEAERSTLPAGVTQTTKRAQVVDELIVRYEAGASAAVRAAARDAAGVAFEQRLPLRDTQLVSVKGSLAAAEARLERQPGVRFAVPNLIVRKQAAAPNDPLFGQLWGIRNTGQNVSGVQGVAGQDVNALAAWDVTRGGGQTVAVVDSGVDLTHPDLQANLWSNPGEVPGNGADDDGNGKADDVHGYDFVSSEQGDPDPNDHDSHGTHVAGTVAAVANNGTGVAGVAPDSKVMAVRVLNGDGSGPISAIASGIVYAAHEGASVINLSLGIQPPAEEAGDIGALFAAAAQEAAARDAVLVVAAGNAANDNDANATFPCALQNPNVICVAALNATGALDADYSNYGATTVDVGAPGTQILSSYPAYGYVFADTFNNLHNWDPVENWGVENSGVGVLGTAASDSPGGNYANSGVNAMETAAAVDLTGRVGCRAEYLVRLAVARGDQFWFDVDTPAGLLELTVLSGSSGGSYVPLDHSLEVISGLPTLPIFSVASNGDGTVADGAYVDNFGVKCRTTNPADAEYESIDGTSMASPHVAGVAALVRAAAPWASADQVVAALKAGTVAHPSLAGKTTTGGRVDAAKAIAAAPPKPIDPPPPPPPVIRDPPPVIRDPPVIRNPPARRGCAALAGKAKANCLLTERIKKTCGKLKGSKRATCGRRVKAIARCEALPKKSKKQKAKRAACLKKAKAIGTSKPKPRRGRRG